MRAAPSEPTDSGYRAGERAAFLRAEQSRRTVLALLLAAGLHMALVAALRRTDVWPEPPSPQIIGYEGPMRLVDLAPRAEARPEQERLARRRLREGALLTREVVVDDDQTAADSRASDRPLPIPEPPRSRPLPTPTAAAPVHFELREDWTQASSASPEARSEDLKTVRIVRPEYPPAAVWAELEGLVRLEVRVSATGRVIDIRVVESPDAGGILTEAAIGAMRGWEFRPYPAHGEAVPFSVVVPFRFRLVD